MAVFFVIFGVIFTVFNKYVEEKTIYYQNLTFRFKFGEKEIFGTRIFCVVGGIVFIAIGLLDLMGIVKFRD